MSLEDYQLIEKAIIFIQNNFQDQPDLATIAEHVGLSEFYFQKLFTRWAGVSPKKFLQHTTINYAKELLKSSRSLLETTYETGLSSQSRLHELFINFEAVTPNTYKNSGLGINITYGITDTPFGKIILAETEKGICELLFITSDEQKYIDNLHKKWCNAQFERNNEKMQKIANNIFYSEVGQPKLSLHLKGTNFQLKVWQALLGIPEGYALSYTDIANIIESPLSVRAVASAIGKNPITYIIPCHRVLRSSGSIGGYSGGIERKRALIAFEATRKHGELHLSNKL